MWLSSSVSLEFFLDSVDDEDDDLEEEVRPKARLTRSRKAIVGRARKSEGGLERK